ncbi:MAG: hypothetical protein IJ711_08560 [Lachnospiraceae bacterium]|nr:hypothetical protein [Lachnospiraceae bacterium]
MSEVKEEILLLSENELKVLLAAKGVQDVYIRSKEGEALDEQELCYIINELVQNQFIEGTQERFFVKDPLDTLLLHIKNAQWIFILRKPGTTDGTLFLYQDLEEYTALFAPDKEMAKYRICSFDRDKLLSTLSQGAAHKAAYVPVLDEEKSYQGIVESQKPVREELLMRFRNIPFLLEVVEAAGGNLTERLLLRNTEKDTIFVRKKGRNVISNLLRDVDVTKQITDLMGEYAK